MRVGDRSDMLAGYLSRNWRLIVPALLVSALAFINGQILFRTVVYVSGPYVFRSIGSSALAILSPALLLYGGIYCGSALLHAARGDSRGAATIAWESVGWGLLGATISLVQGQPRIALGVVLLVVAAAILETRPGWQSRVNRLSLEAVTLAAGIGLLLPLIWMIVASLRLPGLPQPTQLEWFPRSLSLANYARLATLIPLGHYLRNSLLVAALSVPLALLVAAGAGFALVQVAAPLRRLMLALSAIGLAVPAMALWLPRFLLFRRLGLLNTPLVLFYPVLLGGSPLCVLLLYNAFRRVPAVLWEQARLDGAGPIHIWWRIGLPQVGGMLLAMGALIFQLSWSNFIDPLLYLSDRSWHTLPIGLQSLQQLTRSDWPVLMAAAVVMTAPTLLVFALTQRALLDLRVGSPLQTKERQ